MLKFALLMTALSTPIFALATAADDQAQECTDFKNEIPAYFKKGYITVPEDWTQPKGRKIKVFYYGDFGTAQKPPTVFFNGGPTFSSHVSFGQIQTDSKSSDVPVVYIDQRGTGCSTPFPTGETTESANRMSHYGSREIVKDAEFLRKSVLKNRKWRVYGHSYGGLIAHRYLEIAPEGIESLHIYGNSAIQDWHSFYKLRLLSQKRVVENYFLKFPADRELLKNIRQQITPDTCFDNEQIKICGSNMIDAVVMLLGFPSSWGNLHNSLKGILDMTGQVIKSRLGRFVQGFIFQSVPLDPLVIAIIAKMEMSSGDDVDQCTEAMDLLRAQGETPDLWPLNECRLAMSVQYTKADNESKLLIGEFKKLDPITLKNLKKSLDRFPKLKMYLYSGDLDVYVPRETYQEEISFLGSRIEYTNFPDSGHDGYLTEPEVWAHLKN